ncbi:MAG: DUF2236 domain-containing protein [Thermoleophilaceae bacterium]|nr:DUF2236 domain-containing protein [Thermoleophilaceae bacterium]
MADEGYFPRGRSVLRRVHSERAVGLLYGQRALLIGSLHPLNFTGTLLSTRDPERPFARLVHTAHYFETVMFGTRAEADTILERVHALHGQVHGELPEAAGPWPAGTPYSATDPALMLWTVAVSFDSAEALYEQLVRPLSHEEREAFWSDYVLFGELFGIPEGYAPATYADFRAYWRERLASDELHLTDTARRFAPRVTLELPLPPERRPGLEALNLLLLGTVPADIRRRFGIPWGPAREAAFRAGSLAVRHSRPLVPRRVRRGSNRASFDLVAATERRWIKQGRDHLRSPVARPSAASGERREVAS